MKKLTVGVISRKELAEWFGITEQSLQKHRLKKLEVLKKYCNFKIINTRSIEILEVYIDTYSDIRQKYQINQPIGPHNTILLSRVYQNGHSYGKFKCSYCGKEFTSRIDMIIKGSTSSCGCKLKEHYLSKRVDLTGQRYEKLVAIKDIGSKDNYRLWLCQCDCGRTTVVNTSNWKNIASCGYCNLSKGENKIEQILQDNNIKFERQKTFNDCRNINLLRFDFYLPEFDLLIEYDGIQHYEYKKVSDWNIKENFEKTKINDNIKNKWCVDNSKALIRIPYTKFHTLTIEDLMLKTTQFRVV